jgi:ATP-dependent helicase/nuclease subunit B
LCEQTTIQILRQLPNNSERLLTSYYYHLEQQRMIELLDQWLTMERERADFTVHELEARHTFRLAQLELNLRIDRIDQLNDGSWLIIDYKTAQQCQVKQWAGTRLDEPQLPLYQQLLANNDSISGIAFARVHIDGPALVGVATDDCTETMVRFNSCHQKVTGAKDWQQLTEHWQSALTALAQDFIAGCAAVDPKQKPQTCVQCDLASVCRVQMTES